MITSTFAFHGRVLERGFWLYVWEVTPPDHSAVYYVGRTGDSSSRFAQSPFNRVGQHLGFAVTSNMLRKHLNARGFLPETCHYRFIAHGPILPEAKDLMGHRERRDMIAAMEKALAEAMLKAGYEVLNSVKCRKVLDAGVFGRVLDAFAAELPLLARASRGTGIL